MVKNAGVASLMQSQLFRGHHKRGDNHKRVTPLPRGDTGEDGRAEHAHEGETRNNSGVCKGTQRASG